MARALQFNRTSFYLKSKLAPKDKALAIKIEEQHALEDDTLGHRKLGKLLKIGKNRIKRVMKKYGIIARSRKKKYVYPGKSELVFQNIANDTEVIALNINIIFSDLFEFRLADHSKLRGCFALHKQTRQILALIFDYAMKAELVVSTIQSIDFGLFALWHTDQGKSFGAAQTQNKLLEKGFLASMSRSGTPTDNGFAERFVGIFKHAVVRKRQYNSLGDFLKEAEHWINFYNQRRPHEGIGQIAPAKYAQLNGMQVVPYLSNFTV